MWALIFTFVFIFLSILLFTVYHHYENVINGLVDRPFVKWVSSFGIFLFRLKKDEKDSDIIKKYRDRFLVFSYFICFPITWIFLVNAFILGCRYIGSVFLDKVLFWSPIQYDDVLLFLISFGGAIYLAYFQNRIQRVLQAKNDREKKIQDANERLESLRLLGKKKAYAINYNLVKAQDRHFCSEMRYHIVVGDTNGPPFFYQIYYHVECRLFLVDREQELKVHRFVANYLEFDLPDIDIVRNFFKYPVLPLSDGSGPPVLNFCAKISGINTSNNEKIGYDLTFSLRPNVEYGYTDNGHFWLEVEDVRATR